MIDFVSTRSGTSPDTASCCRLIAAVIALAIKDAGEALVGTETRRNQIASDAHDAIVFLFGPASLFDQYAKMIGSSAESIRRALLGDGGDFVPRGLNCLSRESRQRIARRRSQYLGSAVEAA